MVGTSPEYLESCEIVEVSGNEEEVWCEESQCASVLSCEMSEYSPCPSSPAYSLVDSTIPSSPLCSVMDSTIPSIVVCSDVDSANPNSQVYCVDSTTPGSPADSGVGSVLDNCADSLLSLEDEEELLRIVSEFPTSPLQPLTPSDHGYDSLDSPESEHLDLLSISELFPDLL